MDMIKITTEFLSVEVQSSPKLLKLEGKLICLC